MNQSARSSRGGRQQRAPPASYGHTNIPQSHSFGGYYQPSPYSSRPHDLSPIPLYNAPPPPHPRHYGGHQHHGQQQHSPATHWPAPPPSSNTNTMDVETSPSPPTIAAADAASFSTTPASSAEVEEASAAASAASTLSNLANASAGPLKKRRKMAKTLEAKGPDLKDSSVTAQFPGMLHKLLARATDKDSADETSVASALEWLPHGKGWRVLRWDALCLDVLPKEFTGLCDGLFPKPREKARADADGRDDDAGKTAGEYTDEQWVDAFLWHVRAWGFEEVFAGRDRGSFRHDLFVKETPDQILDMKMNSHGHHSSPILTPTQHTPGMDVEAAWRKSNKAVSSIFKPRRNRPHPAHLHVPVLTSTGTSSFAETWGAEHGHALPPHPPPTGRSPRTIRFRDEEETLRQRDDAVEITPSPAAAGRKTLASARGGYGGFVSRRGRRPGLISRHSTH